MALSTFVLVYVVGGVTFVPLLALVFLGFAYLTLTRPAPPADGAATAGDAEAAPAPAPKPHDGAAEKSRTPPPSEPDVAAAYFAVCRDYVPGGINGKPPERSTPAGEVLIAESPSVYQSMYRSIFERGKTQIPTIEGDRRDGRAVKKARNVFFVVLRHGHLMLYDDSEQLEVRHVISLAHHDVDVYAGGDAVPEGDLWIKRNCIRLTRTRLKGDALPLSRPFYLFSDNCSEKEDFYHALLLAQSVILDDGRPPSAKKFDTPDIIKLVQHLHAPDADAHTRWLNAFIGRVFLALYKTDHLENFVRAKINRKISRVSKPNFITSIQIQEIDMGNSAPVISNPRLKELNVNGDMTVEADVKYNGGFKLQMGAVARIDLGARFKAREVHLIMAGILKKLNGHLLIRIKPPPSNRLWLTFETMPQIEMSIEPVVSSRQITYGVILRAIESRIREVIGESLVLPNWDDSPFLDTSKNDYRGGIFDTSEKDEEPAGTATPNDPDAGLVETAVHELTNSANDGNTEEGSLNMLADSNAKTMSMPSLLEPAQKLSSRKTARKSPVTLAGDSVASSTGVSTSTTPLQAPSSPSLLPHPSSGKPRNLRSNSFASAATPLVSTEGANIEAVRANAKKKGQKDAVELVKEVNSRTHPPPPPASPRGSREGDHFSSASEHATSGSSTPGDESSAGRLSASEPDSAGISRRRSEPLGQTPSKERVDLGSSLPSAATIPIDMPSPSSNRSLDAASHSTSSPSHISTAANAAKKWGWQVLNRQNTSSSTSSNSFSFGKRQSTSSTNTSLSSSQSQPPNPSALKAALLAQPMGRGQPLPPPGQPLPGPPKSLWSASNLNLSGLKRKPVPPPLPYRNLDDHGLEDHEVEDEAPKKRPPRLPARPRPVEREGRRDNKPPSTEHHGGDPDVFVVAAPIEDDDAGTSDVDSTHRDLRAYVEDAEDEGEADEGPSHPAREEEKEETQQKAESHGEEKAQERAETEESDETRAKAKAQDWPETKRAERQENAEPRDKTETQDEAENRVAEEPQEPRKDTDEPSRAATKPHAGVSGGRGDGLLDIADVAGALG